MKNIKTHIFEYTRIDIQIIKFLLIGGITFSVDYFTMIFLIEILDINYMISTAVGFIVGSILNYLLSTKFVFVSGKYSRRRTEFLLFFLFTIFGLGINHFVMFVGVSIATINYKIVKLLSTILVTSFNFLTKKIIIFKK